MFRDHPPRHTHHPHSPAEDKDRGNNPDSQRQSDSNLREVRLQHTESQRAGIEPLHQEYPQGSVGNCADAQRESADQADYEAEGGLEEGGQGGRDRPQRQRDCTSLCLCYKPHCPTHWHHQYVPEPSIHDAPDDARQWSQDTKDIHGVYQAILRRDSRRNRRNVEERERDVVNLIDSKSVTCV